MEPVTLPPIRHMLKTLGDDPHSFLSSSIANAAVTSHSQRSCEASGSQWRQPQHEHCSERDTQQPSPVSDSPVLYQCFCGLCQRSSVASCATALPSPTLTPPCSYCSSAFIRPSHRCIGSGELPPAPPLTSPPATAYAVSSSPQNATPSWHQLRHGRHYEQPPEIVFPALPPQARPSEVLPPRLWHQPRYACHQCTKTFSRPSSLRIHMYTHTGEKPYKCPYPSCDRRFSVQSNMRRHARVHYAL